MSDADPIDLEELRERVLGDHPPKEWYPLGEAEILALIQLAEVKRVVLRPGDALVLRVSRQVTEEWMQRAFTHLRSLFPEHNVLVLGPDVDLDVLTEGAATDLELNSQA